MQPHSHLPRLTKVWVKQPIYFVTTCTANRQTILACQAAHDVLRKEWLGMKDRSGWRIGRYVVMPDHVHFFTAPAPDAVQSLAQAVGRWKQWVAKQLLAEIECEKPIWQRQFFDHLLRSSESRTDKWNYVRMNPVRAHLVSRPEDWPFSGKIDFE